MALSSVASISTIASSDRQVAAGQAVFEPVDPATHLFYVRSGEIRVFQIAENGDGRLNEILGPGDWFNAAALSSQKVCGVRAVAATDSMVTAVPAGQFLDHLEHDSATTRLMLQQMADRLVRAREDAARLVFDNCNTRLIQKLLDLSKTVAATPNDAGVELRITHEQLAQAVGAARETISLALTDLRRQNLLRTGRNRLFFDPARLRAMPNPAVPLPLAN